MGMTPDNFFFAFVEENAKDYFEDPSSVRKAFNASISASHMADQFYKFCNRNKPMYISEFGKRESFLEYLYSETNGAFRDIRSISNAYKHLYTDSDKGADQHSNVDSTGALEVFDFGEDSRLESISPGLITSNTVILTRKNKSQVNFAEQLKKVVNFWDKFLGSKTF